LHRVQVIFGFLAGKTLIFDGGHWPSITNLLGNLAKMETYAKFQPFILIFRTKYSLYKILSHKMSNCSIIINKNRDFSLKLLASKLIKLKRHSFAFQWLTSPIELICTVWYSVNYFLCVTLNCIQWRCSTLDDSV